MNSGPTKSKEEAGYTMAGTAERCADCTMFRAPASCTLVKGEISPRGHCDFFDAKRGDRQGSQTRAAGAARLHPDYQPIVSRVFGWLADRYPQAGFRGIELFEPGDRDYSLGYTGDDGIIHLSARWFAAPIVELKTAALCNADMPSRAGIEGPMWHGGMLEPEHTFTHEFGHVLMNSLQAKGDKTLARLLRDGFQNGALVDPVSAPTGYAVPSQGNEDGGEWFADTFAAAHVGNEALKTHPQVALMRSFLDGLT